MNYMKKYISQQEPVLIVRDDAGRVVCGVHHDTQKQARIFYKWEVMDVEEIQMLLNNGQAPDVLNGRTAVPATSVEIKRLVDENNK